MRGNYISASFRPSGKTGSNSTIDEYNNDRYSDEVLSLREQQQNYYHQHHTMPFKSPYSVVTAPKTTKATRSCPGVPHTSQNSMLTARKPRYSPPLFHHSNQRYHPTIHEVSGSYENFPPSDTVDVSGIGDSNRPSLRGVAKKNSSEYNTRISYNINNSSARQRGLYHAAPSHHHKTSEYGSGDPSPTNQYPSNRMVGTGSNVHVVIDNSFDNTDYDSDSDAMPSNVVEVCF